MHETNSAVDDLKPTSPGTATSGMGSALLVLFFFMPWFNACGVADISGSQLATPILPGAPAASWLWGIPLVGLLGLGLAISVWQKPWRIVQQRAKFMLIVPVYSLGSIFLLYLEFQSAGDFTPSQIELRYGLFGTILAAIAVFIGTVIDITGIGQRFNIPMFNQARSQQSLPPANGHALPSTPSPPIDIPRQATRPPVDPPTLPPAPSRQETAAPSHSKQAVATAWLIGRDERIPIEFDQFTIGRHPDNDLTLADPTVSRHHAIIRQGRGRFFIQDQSRHGLYVNDQEIQAQELHDGDMIGVGDIDFEFRVQ